MHIYKSIALPSVEYVRLQHLMLTMIGSRTALASILRRKLGSATALPASSSVDDDIAVSGRQVHFKVDGRHDEVRMLTWQPPKRADETDLSLLSPRGLALLGLGPGESVSYGTEGGRTEFLEVERISEGEARTPNQRVKATRASRVVDAKEIVPITVTGNAVKGGMNA